jgi:hypothetical protein
MHVWQMHYLSPASKNNAAYTFCSVLDWKDLTIVLCLALVVLGAFALAFAAQTFTIVKGKVLEKGATAQGFGSESLSTQTISILIENDDRVFRIKRGSVAKYAISDGDAGRIAVGSEVELLISSHNGKARLLRISGANRV